MPGLSTATAPGGRRLRGIRRGTVTTSLSRTPPLIRGTDGSALVTDPLIHRQSGLLSTGQDRQHEGDSKNNRTCWTHRCPP